MNTFRHLPEVNNNNNYEVTHQEVGGVGDYAIVNVTVPFDNKYTCQDWRFAWGIALYCLLCNVKHRTVQFSRIYNTIQHIQ